MNRLDPRQSHGASRARARQDPSRAICSIGCTMCAPSPSAPIASARGGAEDAGTHKPILFMAVHRADISKRSTMLGERIRVYCKAYHTERNALPELQ